MVISGVEIWGGRKHLKSGGAMAPPAPLVPPPMRDPHATFSRSSAMAGQLTAVLEMPTTLEY